jgi:hypothetical protein
MWKGAPVSSQGRQEMLHHLQSALLQIHQLYRDGQIPHRTYLKIIKRNEEILRLLTQLSAKAPAARPPVPPPAPRRIGPSPGLPAVPPPKAAPVRPKGQSPSG